MIEQRVDSWTPLQTERLLLRRSEAGDRAAAVAIHLDPATNRHHPEPEHDIEQGSYTDIYFALNW